MKINSKGRNHCRKVYCIASIIAKIADPFHASFGFGCSMQSPQANIAAPYKKMDSSATIKTGDNKINDEELRATDFLD